MRRVYGRKVKALIRGGLAETNRNERFKPCSDVGLNGEKSAEVIVTERRRTEQQILELVKGRDMCGKQKIPKGGCPGMDRPLNVYCQAVKSINKICKYYKSNVNKIYN